MPKTKKPKAVAIHDEVVRQAQPQAHAPELVGDEILYATTIARKLEGPFSPTQAAALGAMLTKILFGQVEATSEVICPPSTPAEADVAVAAWAKERGIRFDKRLGYVVDEPDSEYDLPGPRRRPFRGGKLQAKKVARGGRPQKMAKGTAKAWLEEGRGWGRISRSFVEKDWSRLHKRPGKK